MLRPSRLLPLGLLLLASAVNGQPTIPPSGSIALIPGRVMIARGLTLAEQQHLEPDRMLIFRSSTNTFRGNPLPPVPGTPLLCALSPDGRRVAVASDIAVSIIDIEKFAIVQSLPPASVLSWSRDGKRLAMLSQAGKRGVDASGKVTVWSAKDSKTNEPGLDGYDLAYGSGDSLFVETKRGIECLTPDGGTAVRTKHHGALVSPDGRYSLRRAAAGSAPFSIVHDRSGIDFVGCALAAIGTVSVELDGSPFWVSGSSGGHYLCLSRIGTWSLPDTAGTVWQSRTALVDATTSELIFAVPGIAVGPSADGRAIWVYDGADLHPVTVDQIIRNSERRDRKTLTNNDPDARVHVRAVVRSSSRWNLPTGAINRDKAPAGPSTENPKDVHELDVEAGDQFPFWSYSGTNECGGQIRVSRVFDRNQIEIYLNPKLYRVRLPGEPSRSLARFVLGRAPVTIAPAEIITDGSEWMEIQVQP
jgi:hypothetical protein